jgi:hypothetical protein
VGCGGGSVGCSVGGGGGSGVSVAGDGLVGGMEVFVGMMGAVVAEGRNVGGGTTTVLVPLGRACWVRGVKVGIKVRVGVSVRVTVGVAVGMVGVKVGVSEAVGVGAVEVGKGPRSESAVSARAVFVLLAS